MLGCSFGIGRQRHEDLGASVNIAAGSVRDCLEAIRQKAIEEGIS